MGLSIEEQRNKIRDERKQKGELVTVGKVHKFKKTKKKKTKKLKFKKKKLRNIKVTPDYKKKYYEYLKSDEWA